MIVRRFKYLIVLNFAVLCFQSNLLAQSTLPDSISIPNTLGLATSYNILQGTSKVQRLVQLGVKWVRADIAWALIEKFHGIYDPTELDKTINSIREKSFKLVIALNHGNPIYGCSSGMNGTPPGTPGEGCGLETSNQRAAFGNYADYVINRVKTNWPELEVMYEVWNEPDGTWNDKNGLKLPVDTQAPEYVDLVRIIREKIDNKSWGPYKRPAVLVGSLSDIGQQGQGQTFFKKCLSYNVLNYADAVSVHPYRYSNLEMQNPESAGSDYGAIRALMSQYSPGKILPIVVTEWAYPAMRSDTVSEYRNPNWFVDEDQQARYLTRIALFNMTQGIRATFWFNWQDDGKSSNDNLYHWDAKCGLLRGNDSESPAFVSDSILINTLHGDIFETRLSGFGDNCYILKFYNPYLNKTDLAVWTSSSCTDTYLSEYTSGAYTTTSLLGAIGSTVADSRGLKITFDQSPSYITGLPRSPGQKKSSFLRRIQLLLN